MKQPADKTYAPRRANAASVPFLSFSPSGLKRIKSVLAILIIVLFVGQLGFRVFFYRSAYSTSFDATYWRNRYLMSQWVVSNSKNTIGDDGLYTYAAYAYITGRDPTTLNAEIPPLGKYAIGIFILLFHNQNLFALFSGLFALFSFFLLNLAVFKDKLLAFIPVVLFSFEPLFYTQLRAPFLDTFYLSFFFLTFYFFLRKNYQLAGVFLGAMMSVKASSSTFVLVFAVMTLYLIGKRHFGEWKKSLLVIPFSLAIFLLTYFRYFMLGHGLRQFLGVQKWIVLFYANGAKPDPLNVPQMLLIGRWSTWWGQASHIPEWRISWAILFFGFFAYLIYMVAKRKMDEIGLLAIWIVCYLLLFVFVPVWPRYLLLVLPFMYNLTIWLLLKSTGYLFWQSSSSSSIS